MPRYERDLPQDVKEAIARQRLTTRYQNTLRSLRIEYHHSDYDLGAEAAINTIAQLEPEVLGYALWYVYGKAQKPTSAKHDVYGALERFRNSERAQELHMLWRGTDYTPVPVDRSYDLRTNRALATAGHTHIEAVNEHEDTAHFDHEANERDS